MNLRSQRVHLQPRSSRLRGCTSLRLPHRLSYRPQSRRSRPLSSVARAQSAYISQRSSRICREGCTQPHYPFEGRRTQRGSEILRSPEAFSRRVHDVSVLKKEVCAESK